MNLSDILDRVTAQPALHARWLNTLSMMENCGARKIAASEHKTGVTLMVLKHAAEEARHAYYLKKQIAKIDSTLCPDYAAPHLVAAFASATYLPKLDVEVSRYLKETMGLKGAALRYGAYLLVTYAIEVRADELYPVYQLALDKARSKVNVKSIIAEEETHLEEMTKQMKEFFSDWEALAEMAVAAETKLYEAWMEVVGKEVGQK